MADGPNVRKSDPRLDDATQADITIAEYKAMLRRLERLEIAVFDPTARKQETSNG